MATIKDIAKETGLGLATISKYINGGNVRPENKLLLDAAIEKLDFRINEMARSLKTQKSKMVGIVIPKLSNMFTTTIIEEIENILSRSGYATMIMNYHGDEKSEEEIFNFMLSRNVDGLVYMPVNKKTPNLEKFINKGTPAVLVDRQLPDINTDFVGVDNFLAGKNATKLLIKNGHKKIGIIAGPYSLKTTRDRLCGYKNALEDNKIKINDEYIMQAGFNIEDGYKAMKTLLEKNTKITAVFTTNYEMTIGAVMAINEKNIKIPKDISFIGFDNLELASVLSPKLTTVCQPLKDIATHASTLLLERMKKSSSSNQIILNCYIEEGKSIKKLKK